MYQIDGRNTDAMNSNVGQYANRRYSLLENVICLLFLTCVIIYYDIVFINTESHQNHNGNNNVVINIHVKARTVIRSSSYYYFISIHYMSPSDRDFIDYIEVTVLM